MWKWICPICKKENHENYTTKEIVNGVGAIHNCPHCDGLVMIQPNLSCSNFEEFLSEQYAKKGLVVNPKEISKKFIKF